MRHTTPDVNRRRSELWAATAVVLVAGSLALVLLSLEHFERDPFVAPWVLQASVVALGAGFLAYVADQERLLRRIEQERLDERVQQRSLALRLEHAERVLDAARAVNASLDVDAIARVALDQSLRFLGSQRGATLLEADGELVVVASRTQLLAVGDKRPRAWLANGSLPAEPVALTRSPFGRGTTALVVPLRTQGRAIGALLVEAGSEIDEVVRRSLAAFAEHAATAVTNAYLHGALRRDAERIRDGSWVAGEFTSLVE